jgi:hypothetical protein
VIITPFNLWLPALLPTLRSVPERSRSPYLGSQRLQTVLRQFPYPTDSYGLGLPKLFQGRPSFSDCERGQSRHQQRLAAEVL